MDIREVIDRHQALGTSLAAWREAIDAADDTETIEAARVDACDAKAYLDAAFGDSCRRRSEATEVQKLAVLNAVGYELDMLLGAEQLLQWSARYPGWTLMNNCLLEAFCIHARNLLEFFYLKKQPIRAATFVADWGDLRPLSDEVLGIPKKNLWNDLSTRLTHIVPQRGEKLMWNTFQLTQGFLRVTSVWESRLATSERAVVRGAALNVPWDHLGAQGEDS